MCASSWCSLDLTYDLVSHDYEFENLVWAIYCIPRQKSQRFPFARDNLKNILVGPFRFGMWVYMGNATNTIVLSP